MQLPQHQQYGQAAHASPVVFSFSACVFAVRRNIGIALLAHLILLLVDPVFAFTFGMTMGTLHVVTHLLEKKLPYQQQAAAVCRTARPP